MSSTRPIVVIGAGVLGLSAATLLQERYPNTSITIIAAELPTPSPMQRDANGASPKKSPSADYASMWAGAHYRPIPRANAQLEDEYWLARATARRMKRIAQSHGSTSGVKIVPAAEYLEKPPVENVGLRSGDVYAFEGDGFHVFGQNELDAFNSRSKAEGQIQWACTYTTYVVNVHLYCGWLLERFLQNGGQVEERRLDKLEQAFEVGKTAKGSSPLVVNCSGRNFDTDPETDIIRGQTVLVRQEFDKTITRQNEDGSWSFLIPRPEAGGTIVGGTKEIGDAELSARPETRRKLLENAAKYFPEFVADAAEFELVQDNVGRRPWRKGGMRIEVSQVGANETVVHAYGAGGRGYELSWGVAERVLELVEGYISSKQSKL